MGTIPTITTFTAGATLTAANLNAIKAAVDFWALTPRALATDTSGFSVPNNSDTVVPLPGETYDIVQSGDTPMHDTSTNNSRVVIRTSGKYSILGALSFANNASGSPRRIKIRKNGVTPLQEITVAPNASFSTMVQRARSSCHWSTVTTSASSRSTTPAARCR